MKRNLILVFFASLLLFAYSCSDDDDPVSSNSADIVGTWTMQKYTTVAGGNSMDFDVSAENQKVEFKEDGTYSGYLYGLQGGMMADEGNYDYDGSKLSIESDGDKIDFEATVSGNNLTISSTQEIMQQELSITMTLTK